MSLSRIARLLKIGIDFGRLASGLEIINPVPEKITYDYELTALKRIYGDDVEIPELAEPPSLPVAPASAAVAADPPLVPVMPPAMGGAGGLPPTLNSPSVPAGGASDPPQEARCDARSRWARIMRRMKS